MRSEQTLLFGRMRKQALENIMMTVRSAVKDAETDQNK